MDEKKEINAEKFNELKEIMPLKDFVINFNGEKTELKKGVKAEVKKIFLQNLKTEKVIK